MKKTIMRYRALIIGALILPSFVYAQAPASPINSASDIVSVVNKIFGWIQTIFWIVAIASVFYAAFLFLTSSGDDKKLDKAKKQLLYSVIAIAVGLIAFGLVPLVKDILTPSSSQS